MQYKDIIYYLEINLDNKYQYIYTIFTKNLKQSRCIETIKGLFPNK